jgi:hypothetical protein
MLVGALFYYFLSLMFLRKTLQLFALSNKNIILTLLLFGLATNATQYINNEATFSHIYCMFLVSVFVFLVKKLQLDYKTYLIYLVSIVLGLLSITRLVDLLIIFSLPFIIGNSYAFKQTLKKIFIDKISILIALFIFLLIASLQLIIWYLQYGSFFLDTYQAETFNFLKPELINFWFSYRKGLFLYTPITLISIVTGIILFFKKEYYLAFTFFLFFFLVSYVLSSWWSWWYSCGYGQRAFIGYYPVLFVFYALSLNYLKGLIKKIIIFISLLTIFVNHIQARQYKNFILNWEDMDRIKYWNVFLSNSNRFIGFNNKLNINEDYLRIRIRKKIKDQLILPNTIASIAQINMPLYEKGFIVKVTNYDSFEHNNRANLELCLKDKENDTLFFKNITYTNLTNSFLGESSQGTYYYRIPSVVNASNLTLTISTNQTPVRFKNAMFILFEIK